MITQNINQDCKEVAKSQGVRLFDVLILGPWLMFLAARGSLTKEQKTILFLMGLGTVIYNARNYYLTRLQEKS